MIWHQSCMHSNIPPLTSPSIDSSPPPSLSLSLTLSYNYRGIPSNYKILFLQGGGAAQFAALPINLCESKDSVADYIVTGSWSKQAAQEVLIKFRFLFYLGGGGQQKKPKKKTEVNTSDQFVREQGLCS
jgi:hypothetical protein